MQNWEYKKLGDVCDIYQPQTISSKELIENGEYPVYGANGVIGFYNKYNHEQAEVLLTCRGSTCGTVNKSVPFSWINGNAMVIHPLNDEELSKDYLIYALHFLDYSHIITGAAQPQITRVSLAPTEIPLPPLEEQKRIVKILDEKFAQLETVKANAKANLQNAKDLFQSQLTKAFSNTTWEKKRLDDVCAITSKLVDPTLPEYLDLYHVGGANIESETGVIIDLKTSEEEGLSSGKFTFDDTMVLYNKIRPYLKKVARPDFSGLCSADMYPLSPKNNITKDYLYYILTSDDFTEYAISKSGRAGMPKVNREALFAYECYLPPLPEQKRIVEQLDSLSQKVRSLEEIYTKQLANCDELKQAFLAKAFNGEI